MNKARFFMAIGPAKTGTTWLYHNLKQHPEVSLPSVKEIRYFWGKEFVGNSNAITNIFGKHWQFKTRRRWFTNSLKQHYSRLRYQRSIHYKQLKWDLRYFIGTQNTKWYQGLFDDRMLSGDLTPSYCELPDRVVKGIHTLIPKCKIIIGLRDPVEREWSKIRMVLLKMRNRNTMTEVPDREVEEYFTNNEKRDSLDYVEIIKRWESYFGKSQVFVYYFDQLQHNAQEVFDSICGFLEINQMQLTEIAKERNKGINEPIPNDFLETLISRHYHFLVKMEEKMGNEYVKSWIRRYEKKHSEMEEADLLSSNPKLRGSI